MEIDPGDNVLRNGRPAACYWSIARPLRLPPWPQHCAQGRIPTILDVDEMQPGMDTLLRQIDAIISAEEFPCALTGHRDLGRALGVIEREYRAPLVCVTLGSNGSLARVGGREIRTPAFQVDCVDSTGAGDAFRGGFAAGCLRAPEGDLRQFSHMQMRLERRPLALGAGDAPADGRGNRPSDAVAAGLICHLWATAPVRTIVGVSSNQALFLLG